MAKGRENLMHVLEGACDDPDCELHHVELVEDDSCRWTSQAYVLIGARAYAEYFFACLDNSLDPVDAHDWALDRLKDHFEIPRNIPDRRESAT